MGLKISGLASVPPKLDLPSGDAAAPVAKKGSELQAILSKIQKEKGDKVVIKGSAVPQVRRQPTGVFEFDLATGGGFPKGRYSIVFGDESVGKTNICYCAAAKAQQGPAECNKVVWVDLEGTFDPTWAQQFGVDTDSLILVKPGFGEEAVDLIDALVRAEDVALLVVDSLAVVVSSKEIGQSVETHDVGTSSILVKRLCNKLVIALSEELKRGHDPAVILINQTRHKIGVMFGNPETMPGGKTMKFLASLIVRMSGKNKVVKTISATVPAFKETTARVTKAKVGVLQYEASYDLCMLPHDGLTVGESDSWNAVKNHLQAFDILQKTKDGWRLFGVNYPKQEVIRDTYRAEPDFAIKCQQAIIERLSQTGLALVEPEPNNHAAS